MNMIEKVAIAIAINHMMHRNEALRCAKAAIEAMHDYHDNMNAEAEATGHGYFTYEMLINAALKEYSK